MKKIGLNIIMVLLVFASGVYTSSNTFEYLISFHKKEITGKKVSDQKDSEKEEKENEKDEERRDKELDEDIFFSNSNLNWGEDEGNARVEIFPDVNLLYSHLYNFVPEMPPELNV